MRSLVAAVRSLVAAVRSLVAAVRSLLMLTLIVGCTPSMVEVRATPADALKIVEARLAEREIELDAAGRRPDRVRTGTFCYVAPDATGASWDRSFARPVPGPGPFEIEGTLEEQHAAEQRCRHIFRVELNALPHDGGAKLVAESAWWKLQPGICAPVGDPLLGVVRCHYRYVGAQAPADVLGFVYGLVEDL